jgi:hypothetical protein
MSDMQKILYAGLSHVTYKGEPFDLGHGITLRSSYAHLFATNMLAVARNDSGRAHPGPWYAASGGFNYDIDAEMAVSTELVLPGGLAPYDAIWLLAALLRLSEHPYLMVPVVSDLPFDETSKSKRGPTLKTFEVAPRIVMPNGRQPSHLSSTNLTWVKSVWPQAATLIGRHRPFHRALRAVDACTIEGRRSSVLLTAWGALEELFVSQGAELRFRVSANIATYLEPAGPKRLEMFKTVTKLYKERSRAAHTGHETGLDALLQSFIILRNCLVKILDDGVVPKEADLERRLFLGDV